MWRRQGDIYRAIRLVARVVRDEGAGRTRTQMALTPRGDGKTQTKPGTIWKGFARSATHFGLLGVALVSGGSKIAQVRWPLQLPLKI